MKKYFCLVFLFFGRSAGAQQYADIFRVYANNTPLNKFDSSGTSTRVKEIVADLSVPIKLSNKSAIITGVIYEGLQVKLFPEQNYTTLTALTIKAGLTGKFNDNWSGTIVMLPKIASNVMTINDKTFQIGSIAYLKYKKRENLNYRMGFYANSDLFGPFFVPMLGMYYLSEDKKFETTLMMPFQGDANYTINNFFSLGINYNAQVRTFYLSDITPLYRNTYVTKITDEIFLYTKLNLNKNMSVQARIGQSFARSYHVFNTNDKVTLGLPAYYIGDNRRILNSGFSNGLIFQIVFLYRVDLPK